MKLIEQKIIYFKQGNSDKVYEVDLCQLNDTDFVVNFRYGRRGGNLKDGTKTVLPVDEVKAKKVYNDLIQSKIKKGYKESLEEFQDDFEESEADFDKEESAPVSVKGLSAKESAVLSRIKQGESADSNWDLSRAIWKAGELQIKEASMIAMSYLGRTGMMDYSILWMAGRCGDAGVIPFIKQTLQKTLNYPDFDNKAIYRLACSAGVTLAVGDDLAFFKNEIKNSLSHKFASTLDDTSGSQLRQLLETLPEQKTKEDFVCLEKLYLLDPPGYKQWFTAFLRDVPLKPGSFQFVRHMYKLSEQMLDPEVFGLLTMRFENCNQYYNSPEWIWKDSFHIYNSEVGSLKVHLNDMKKEDPPVAYSSKTRHYLRRRSWRLLDGLGRRKSRHYVRLAARVLAEIDDKDGREPSYSCFYDWDDGYKMSKIWKDKFSHYFAANWILYGKSQRYKVAGNKHSFVCDGGWEPGNEIPPQREESFSELWDKDTHLLLDLVIESRAEAVHQFCAKILKNHPEVLESASVEILIGLLNSPYSCTADMALQSAKQSLSKTHSLELLKAFLDSEHEAHRQVAYEYYKENESKVCSEPALISLALGSSQTQSRELCSELISSWSIDNEVLSKALTCLLEWVKNSEAEEYRAGISKQVKKVYSSVSVDLSLQEIEKLMQHDYLEIQEIGAALLLGKGLSVSELPDGILQSMINSGSESIRDSALKLMFQFTDAELIARSTLIHSLLTHELDDLRENGKPVFIRLCSADKESAFVLTDSLLDILLRGRVKKDLLNELSNFILTCLLVYLDKLSKEKIKRLLTVKVPSANKVGGALMGMLSVDDFENSELAQMLDNPTFLVRENTRKILDENIERFVKDPLSFVSALDSSWQDSKDYVFDLFSTKAETLNSDTLIAVCDSTDDRVQKFGRELLMKNFENEDAVQYIQHLSEHPSQNIQLFVSSILEAKLSGHPEEVRKLLPFVKTCLIKVNKGRVIKQRLISFIEKESVKSVETAEMMLPILRELSSVVSVELKASTIKCLVRIQKAWPELLNEGVSSGV